MRSSEGEEIELVDVISTSKAKGQVEKWLLELESIMKRSVHRKVKESFEDYPECVRDQWVLKWPGQCVPIVLKFYTVFPLNLIFLGSKYIVDILDV